MYNTYNEKLMDSRSINQYKTEMKKALTLSFPGLYENEIDNALDFYITKHFKDTNVELINNYTNKTQQTTLFNVIEYIIEREPIVTVAGVMFKKHGTCPNPYVDLIQEFLSSRSKYKDLMFSYPIGSEMYERYNILQLSEKVSGNAVYGSTGNHTSIFYNLYVAQSITMQGKACISVAILLFESMMANNVKFGSLNEAITFITNVISEEKYTNDDMILDKNITVEECFYKVVSTFGFYYIPTEKDLMIIWDILNQTSQQNLNRIFYKNNLFCFTDNSFVFNKVIGVLASLDEPFMDPNKPPKCIEEPIEELYELIKEWVYYDKQYIDKIDRTDVMYRTVSVLTDTDSCFISFDGWYRYILDKSYHIPMKIKELEFDTDTGETNESFDVRYDYDFYSDEVIEMEEEIRPNVAGPGAIYRTSIINVLAYIMGKISIDYFQKYSNCSNTIVAHDGSIRKSFFILKNEFQIKRMLIPDVKKHYCSLQERQEAKFIPKDKALNIKGMPITKIGIPEKTKVRLKQILLNDVLNAGENLSQINIVKQLAVLEKQIFNSILSGSKEYFKEVRIKSKKAYDNPMGQYGIKASVAYNYITQNTGKEPIDLDERNSIIVIKTDINLNNCADIKDSFPKEYENIVSLLSNYDIFKGTINYIAIPEMESTPEWVKPFISYTEIINDNLKTFPCEALGIDRKMKDTINFTNILHV